jgi:hypothetical protein
VLLSGADLSERARRDARRIDELPHLTGAEVHEIAAASEI